MDLVFCKETSLLNFLKVSFTVLSLLPRLTLQWGEIIDISFLILCKQGEGSFGEHQLTFSSANRDILFSYSSSGLINGSLTLCGKGSWQNNVQIHKTAPCASSYILSMYSHSWVIYSGTTTKEERFFLNHSPLVSENQSWLRLDVFGLKSSNNPKVYEIIKGLIFWHSLAPSVSVLP